MYLNSDSCCFTALKYLHKCGRNHKILHFYFLQLIIYTQAFCVLNIEVDAFSVL